MDKLEECPYCGEIPSGEGSIGDDIWCTNIKCKNFNNHMPREFWNVHPKENSLQIEVDILKKEIQTIKNFYATSHADIRKECDFLQENIDALKKEIQENISLYNTMQNKYNTLQKTFDEYKELSKKERGVLQDKLKEEEIKHQRYIETTEVEGALKLRNAETEIETLKNDIQTSKTMYVNMLNKRDILQKTFNEYIEDSEKENKTLRDELDSKKIEHQFYMDTMVQSNINVAEKKLRKIISSYNFKLNNIRLDEDKVVYDVLGKMKGKTNE